MSVDEYGSSPPDHSTRHRPFFCERADAIGSDHTVFEISTIDASHCRRQAACDFSQVTAGFTDEPSLTALTEHMSSFYWWHRLLVAQTSRSAEPHSQTDSEWQRQYDDRMAYKLVTIAQDGTSMRKMRNSCLAFRRTTLPLFLFIVFATSPLEFTRLINIDHVSTCLSRDNILLGS